VTNAIQASPAGEKVRVKTSLKEKEVILKISDSGKGIGEEDQWRQAKPGALE
jgi:signal transduction histidine kinase